MTITQEQIKDLREGDIVRIRHRHWPKDMYSQGPIWRNTFGAAMIGGINLDNWADVIQDFEVVERAPRPLYVNHTRDYPAPGDVVRPSDGTNSVAIRIYGHYEGVLRASLDWYWPNGTVAKPGGRGLTLLVDGETGQVVPPAGVS